MDVITSDWEVTTYNTGSPFDPRNKAVCLGIKEDNKDTYCLNFLKYQNLTALNTQLKNKLLVFFNAKFDIHWYRRLGLSTVLEASIWCCQIAEFLLSGQQQRYPSLENTAIKYDLGHKIDVIKEQYWNEGINTDKIPTEILHEYCIQDVNLTYSIYLKQLEQFQRNPKLFTLFKLMCQDLLVLEEMEWNGLLFNEELCNQRAEELDTKIKAINQELSKVYPDIPINFGSPDQLSAFLYGGSIPRKVSKHVGFYKNGKPKYKLEDEPWILPRLVEPLKGSELKKENVYSTDEATLRKLKGQSATKFVGPLLHLSEFEKLRSTYYQGLPKINQENHWPKGEIHGQFNQVVAATGRLSSTKPNLQNFSGDCLDIFISKYGND